MKDNLSKDIRELKEFYDRITVRKYKDMADKFNPSANIKGNPVIYKVYIKDFKNFEYGLTVINPGKIGKEYYMTKGHKHNKALDEIYILVKGKGELWIKDSKMSETEKIKLKKSKLYHVPGNSGHRLVNTGKKELWVMTIYSKDAGHDYNFDFNAKPLS